MRHWLFFIGLNVFLIACVESNVDQTFTDDQRRQAVTAQINCLKQSVARVDDGVSDATTIATIALKMCEKEAGAAAYMFASKLEPAARRKFLQMVPASNLQIAVETVLLERAQKS